MKTVLLAGGLGVRLRPLTYTIPKPLLPVGEHPILEEIIIRLRAFGFRDLVIAVGYRAELIETYFRDGSQLGVRIEYTREHEALGTAGPLALVRAQFEDQMSSTDSLLVMNGDLLTEIDMADLVEAHEAGGQDITVVTREYQLRHPFGVLQLDGERITGIVEKPAVTDIVNAGIYVFRWSVLDLVPDARAFEMPQLLNAAVAKGLRVVSHPFEGTWLAIDGMAQLEDAAKIAGVLTS
ncbi:MAG TPA: sugar phosphate nucleotidyltransferase [Acidimicrobiales bacterium]|nr:sugar phosphate nucleotidyltransferase [Acidimicrobiales bacterium]